MVIEIGRRLEVLGLEALQAAYAPTFEGWAHGRVEGDVTTCHSMPELLQQASQRTHARPGDRYDVDMHELIHPPELIDTGSIGALLA